ncbi:MAG: caspase family protein [Candidatus Parabeggiatoa sp. nov. 1]|nr:MAG: caspase family protein [Gammaproteobacteria bacterium]
MSKQHFTNGHALIIGVGADLPGTINDAEGFANILKDEGRCAYPPEQVALFTSTDAHRQAVLKALDDLAQATDEASTMILYFSGHGYKHGNAYYLMTYGYQLDDLDGTTISGAEFADKIAAIPAKQKVILLDCCHAGGVGHIKGLSLTKSPLPLPSEAMDLFSQGAGYILIASSTEQEYSFTGEPYSVFTGVLIEALCGTGVAKKDGYVRVADLALHTREQVPKLTQDRQHPILHFEQADNFIIAYYAAGDTQPKICPVSTQNASYQHNPYNFWVPVIPAQFVGRVKELRQLEMQ